MKADTPSVLEMMLIIVYVLGSFSTVAYFLHSLAILICSQRPGLVVQLELVL